MPLINHWRLFTDRDKSADEIAMIILDLFRHHGISHKSIDAIAISSVVPTMMGALEKCAGDTLILNRLL